MPQYLAKLPQSTQNAIGYVRKITGTYNGNSSGGDNSVTGDKCFILSGKEIFGGSGAGNGFNGTTNEANATVQYQYFQRIATSTASRTINSNYQWWWLRSPDYNQYNTFGCVDNGSAANRHTPMAVYDVFPAFCIY